MDFIPIIISLAALLLSLLSYLRERRLITVDFDTNCFALDVTKNIEAPNNVFENSTNQYAIFTTAIIVNASTSNSSYFDLRAYNPKTNENHFLCTLSSVPWLRDHPSLLISPFGPKALENFIIDLPKSRCGPITSGSCYLSWLSLIKIFLLKRESALNLKFLNMLGYHGIALLYQHLIEKNLSSIKSITIYLIFIKF